MHRREAAVCADKHLGLDGHPDAGEEDGAKSSGLGLRELFLDVRKQAGEDLDEAGEEDVAVGGDLVGRVSDELGLLRADVDPSLPTQRPIDA